MNVCDVFNQVARAAGSSERWSHASGAKRRVIRAMASAADAGWDSTLVVADGGRMAVWAGWFCDFDDARWVAAEPAFHDLADALVSACRERKGLTPPVMVGRG